MKYYFFRLFQVSGLVLGLIIPPLSLSAMNVDSFLDHESQDTTDTSHTQSRPRSQSDLNPQSPGKSQFSRKVSASEPSDKIYIVIVEDIKNVRTILELMINSYFGNREKRIEREEKTYTIEVKAASNAEEGIAYWKAYNPELIFLDSHLGPGKSGKEILLERIEYCSDVVLTENEKQIFATKLKALESQVQKAREELKKLVYSESKCKKGKKNNQRNKRDYRSLLLKESEDELKSLLKRQKRLRKSPLRIAKKNIFGITLGHVVCISSEKKDNQIMIELGANEACPKPIKRDAVSKTLRKLFPPSTL